MRITAIFSTVLLIGLMVFADALMAQDTKDTKDAQDAQ